ncbi:MAG: hypothetical protein AAF533_29515 [Acidobacteriota bacterium]
MSRERVLAAVENLVAHLRESGEADVGRRLESLAADFRADPRHGLTQLLGLFGGAGSFNDLVLHDDGVALHDENTELDQRRQQLHAALMDPELRRWLSSLGDE